MKRSESLKWGLFLLLVSLAVFFVLKKPVVISNSASTAILPFGQPNPHSPVAEETEWVPLFLLQRPVAHFEDVNRNIFLFVDTHTFSTESVQPDEAQMAAVVPSADSVPEAPDVRYLGYYREREGENKKLAAISNDGQIYIGGPGDVLGNRYRVLVVEDEFLILLVLADNRIIRFPLGQGQSFEVPQSQPDH